MRKGCQKASVMLACGVLAAGLLSTGAAPPPPSNAPMPGTTVVIDPAEEGTLRLSAKAVGTLGSQNLAASSGDPGATAYVALESAARLR